MFTHYYQTLLRFFNLANLDATNRRGVLGSLFSFFSRASRCSCSSWTAAAVFSCCRVVGCLLERLATLVLECCDFWIPMTTSHRHWHWSKILAFLAVTMTATKAFSPSALSQSRLNTELGTLTSRGKGTFRRAFSQYSFLGAKSRTKEAPSKSTLPRRNAKHRKRREQPVSEQQVANHVAHKYLHGSGGALRQSSIKSNRRLTETEQGDYLKMLDRHPALLLNADYQPMSSLPLSLWHWQEAVKAVFSGKVTVVDVYEDVKIRAANLEVALPSVIALTEYVPQFNQVRKEVCKRCF